MLDFFSKVLLMPSPCQDLHDVQILAHFNQIAV